MLKNLIISMIFCSQIFAQSLYPKTPPIPGSLCTEEDPDYAESRYEENVAVCERNVSSSKKNEICWRDGVPDRTNYTVDHMIPLFMGGSNHDDNLWCQHKSIFTGGIEQKIYFRLRNGEITQMEAILAIKKIKFRQLKEDPTAIALY